ncbi:hypothetical protein BBJ29_003355 [Phytophthora kernoviae]|uniref:Uncharacterized protein n=1 Tax=Phytophthora kernoviae TaxID=325452 RepID=A0A3F2RVB8_9STRA|nr:hypothetical protein BBJ29_003355 [Phytophthora kernoviae]RLN64906.1 hypothetical protein BBP00_00003152 [Phytophthora kernoviae]
MYVGFAASGDADRMREVLKELQDALFHNSVNDAMMRIAKEAALSAKAKIAEQAAQQQANSRGGSLFSTTRHLLSRGGGGAGGAHGPGISGSDNKGEHAGADTPTTVKKEGQKVAIKDTAAEVMANRSRHKPRFVSLRRKGQSGEEVRKMELNLDAINGGLDEVKWKCAMFLYDVEEVAHVAPSQIRILAYPSKLPLAGKTDRSALTKLVKPDTIWTVDIGANNSDMLNDW